MVKKIVLNSSNYVTGGNNLYIYTLPQSAKFFQINQRSGLFHYRHLIHRSIYSLFVVTIHLTFILNASTPVTYTWTIPDSYMGASDLNKWLQSQFIANNLYVTVNNGTQNVYFLKLYKIL